MNITFFFAILKYLGTHCIVFQNLNKKVICIFQLRQNKMISLSTKVVLQSEPRYSVEVITL